MLIERTPLDGVMIITPRRFADPRGYFVETWNRKALSAAGLDLPEFVQDNLSLSVPAGTVRGLHFQSPPHGQGKLVRCARGRLFDVAVDARKGSLTYGQWFGLELSAENGRQLWIPVGFLHGFATLVDNTEIAYKCTDHYAPDCDGGVRWDTCGIDWPLPAGVTPLLSDKDSKAQPFSTFESPIVFGEIAQ